MPTKTTKILFVGPIRVMIVPCSGGRYFAQALEVDYFGEGCNIEETIRNFVEGFRLTLSIYEQDRGSFHKFMRPAPNQCWEEFYRLWFMGGWTQLKETVSVPVISIDSEISQRDVLPFGSFIFLKTEVDGVLLQK
jgi:hypothetical protein